MYHDRGKIKVESNESRAFPSSPNDVGTLRLTRIHSVYTANFRVNRLQRLQIQFLKQVPAYNKERTDPNK